MQCALRPACGWISCGSSHLCPSVLVLMLLNCFVAKVFWWPLNAIIAHSYLILCTAIEPLSQYIRYIWGALGLPCCSDSSFRWHLLSCWCKILAYTLREWCIVAHSWTEAVHQHIRLFIHRSVSTEVVRCSVMIRPGDTAESCWNVKYASGTSVLLWHETYKSRLTKNRLHIMQSAKQAEEQNQKYAA